MDFVTLLVIRSIKQAPLRAKYRFIDSVLQIQWLFECNFRVARYVCVKWHKKGSKRAMKENFPDKKNTSWNCEVVVFIRLWIRLFITWQYVFHLWFFKLKFRLLHCKMRKFLLNSRFLNCAILFSRGFCYYYLLKSKVLRSNWICSEVSKEDLWLT